MHASTIPALILRRLPDPLAPCPPAKSIVRSVGLIITARRTYRSTKPAKSKTRPSAARLRNGNRPGYVIKRQLVIDFIFDFSFVIGGFKFEVQRHNPEGCEKVASGRSEAKTTGWAGEKIAPRRGAR